MPTKHNTRLKKGTFSFQQDEERYTLFLIALNYIIQLI